MLYDPVFRTEDERNPDYWREVAFMEFIADLDEAMEARDVNRTMLAERLETSRAYITKALRGDAANMTLATMVKFGMVVGRVLRIHLAHPHTTTTWTDRTRQDRIASQTNENEYVMADSEPAQFSIDRKVRGRTNFAVAAFPAAA